MPFDGEKWCVFATLFIWPGWPVQIIPKKDQKLLLPRGSDSIRTATVQTTLVLL